MVAPAEHLRREAPAARVVTICVVLAALAAGAVYIHWRVTSSLDGAFLPVGVALLAVDAIVLGRFLLVAVPGLCLSVGADAGVPTDVPRGDVVIVVRDESARALHLAIVSCREVRGSDGLIVVGGYDRPEIRSTCMALGVPHVRHEDFEHLGTEPHRTAPYVVLVPASVLVSPDLVVAVSPAFEDESVGAATGSTTIHSTVQLIGSRGYGATVDSDERLAARLDRVGCSPPLDGPLVFRKAALLEVGGVDWAAGAPELAAHQAIQRAGWRTRFVHPPVAYRMAPPTEAEALQDRQARMSHWRTNLARPAASSGQPDRRRQPWAQVPRMLQRLESVSVLGRLTVILTPTFVALTGHLPLTVDDRPRWAVIVAAWFVLAALAQAHLSRRRVVPFETLRSGARVLGVDLAALLRRPGTQGVNLRWQYACLGTILLAALVCVWATTIASSDLSSGTRLVLAACAIAGALLVRDATTGYRQQRYVPRVAYDSRGYNDIIELSPAGYVIESPAEVGSVHRVEINLVLPDHRSKRLTLQGVVKASRDRHGVSTAFVEVDPNVETFADLYYFCAVTAPTIRWLGGSARVETEHREPLAAA